MSTSLHLPHLPRPRAAAVAAVALPAAVALGLYLALTALAGTGGELGLAVPFAICAVPMLAISVQEVIRDGRERRAGSRLVLVAWSVFLFFVDVGTVFAVGLGACSNDAPPPVGSPVDRFCNGPAFGVFQWGLLCAFPVLLLGFLARRRHPRNLPFVVALVTAAASQIALLAALP